jgi:lipopolysaccharide transport system ATP-binding protein
MGDVALRVEGLGKQYRIGKAEAAYRTFRDVLADTLSAPFRRAVGLLRGNAAAANNLSETIWALRDVSFEVKKGEVVGIIGRNGAGKSTLLKILSSITEPSIGEAKLYGRVGALLEVGTGFHPELTGRENIYLNGAILGMSRAEIRRKFDEIVAFAEVEKFIDTPVKHYSSGMGLRLGFAVAAHLEPEILIVDEVLAVGDAAFQKKCLGKMGEVAGEGRTVLFVSHNMAAVNQLCGRAVWLNNGQSVADGETNAVVQLYLESNSTETDQREWASIDSAPGDDKVRLLKVQLIQQALVTAIIDINQPCEIEFVFAVLRPVQNLVPGIFFHNIEGICLFAHLNWSLSALSEGIYRNKVVVPSQIFAEDHISITLELVFHNPYTPSVHERNILSFQAVDSDHPDAVRGPYKGHWVGVVRPQLHWSEIERIADFESYHASSLHKVNL